MRKYTAFLISIALFVQVLFIGCSNQKVNKQPKPVKTYVTSVQQKNEIISISGNVKPSKTVKLAFKIPGVIQKLGVNEGDILKKGQIVGNLESDEYRLGFEAADSEYEALSLKLADEIPSLVNQASAQKELVEKRHARIKSLYESGGVSKDKLDEAESSLVVARNKYQQALDSRSVLESQIEKARAMSDLAFSKLEDTKIFSPIDGIVIQKLAEEGETVASGYPVAVIGAVDHIDVEMEVADSQLQNFEKGQKVKVYIYGIEKEYEGVVYEIGSAADPGTRTFSVKTRIENTKLDIRPGMIARVDTELEKLESIFVPVESIMKGAGDPYVFVVDKKDNKAKKRIVKTGKMIEDQIQVLSGIDEGDHVVIQGQYKLVDLDVVSPGGVDDDKMER